MNARGTYPLAAMVFLGSKKGFGTISQVRSPSAVTMMARVPMAAWSIATSASAMFFASRGE